MTELDARMDAEGFVAWHNDRSREPFGLVGCVGYPIISATDCDCSLYYQWPRDKQ